jgi:hypothetical protein
MWLQNNKTTVNAELIKNELHTDMYKQQLIYTVDRILQEKDFTVLTSFRTNTEFTKKKYVFSLTLTAFK